MHLRFSHIHMCTPEPPYINSRGPIAPVSNHCPIRRILAIGGCFKNLNPLSQRGAFPGHCPASRWYIIRGQWMIFALYVSVWLPVSHWKRASWQLLAAPGESLCENFLQPENQTHHTLCNCCSCLTQSTAYNTHLFQLQEDRSHFLIYFSGAYLES